MSSETRISTQTQHTDSVGFLRFFEEHEATVKAGIVVLGSIAIGVLTTLGMILGAYLTGNIPADATVLQLLPFMAKGTIGFSLLAAFPLSLFLSGRKN